MCTSWCQSSCISLGSHRLILSATFSSLRSGLFHTVALLHRCLLDTLNPLEWLETGQTLGHHTDAVVPLLHHAGRSLRDERLWLHEPTRVSQ